MINEFNITSAEYQIDENGNNSCIQANIDGRLTIVPLDPANRHYQEVLDAIIEQGAACFEGDIPSDLQAAADAKAASDI